MIQNENVTMFIFVKLYPKKEKYRSQLRKQILKKIKAQFRGLYLSTNQVTASDKVNPSATFKSANGKILQFV